MQTETMKQTAAEVQSRRNDIRADVIMAEVEASPNATADEVIAALDEAAAEHAANVAAEK